jgi:hypothetical protein
MDEEEFITFAQSITNSKDKGRENGKAKTFFSAVYYAYQRPESASNRVIKKPGKSENLQDGLKLGIKMNKRLK